MLDQPLTGVKVLDLTWHVAGPYCTKLLADYGAEVIKVEHPDGGDPARRLGPFPGDVPHPERSGTFLLLNTNKRSITLDLKSEAGRGIVERLARDVDVVVESFRPGVMERLGLDYDTLSRENPRLVMTRVWTRSACRRCPVSRSNTSMSPVHVPTASERPSGAHATEKAAVSVGNRYSSRPDSRSRTMATFSR